MKNLSLFVLLFLLAGTVPLPYHKGFRPNHSKHRHHHHRSEKSYAKIKDRERIIENQEETIYLLNLLLDEKMSEPEKPTRQERRRAYLRGLRIINNRK